MKDCNFQGCQNKYQMLERGIGDNDMGKQMKRTRDRERGQVGQVGVRGVRLISH